MKWFEGKKGLVLGIANDNSIAWAIAREIMENGGVCGFSHLPDRPDDDKKKNRMRVSKCVDQYPSQSAFLEPLDVQEDSQVEAFMKLAESNSARLISCSTRSPLPTAPTYRVPTVETSRAGFKLAMDVSVYSLISVTNYARPLFNPGASVVAMTYFGGEKCVPGYNVMGICKAALDANIKYLPLTWARRRPSKCGQRRSVEDPGRIRRRRRRNAGVLRPRRTARTQCHPRGSGPQRRLLAQPLQRRITGEILHVDAGYNIMGSPGRLLDQMKASS